LSGKGTGDLNQDSPKFQPSPEQAKVIAHRGGHLQVIACAGAGKTEAISRRVSTLIGEGVEPCQIVAFTFTERAASGLKNGITRRIAESKGQAFLDRLGPMFVGTIHAYCLRLLHPARRATGLISARAP
jgi:DNA helicase-2/ATP-dependent DNA helicase PcrA